MAAPLLGESRLHELLESSCRLALANRMPADSPATIVAAAFVSHYDDGSTRTLAVYDLDLAPGQSAVFDEDRPSGSRVIAVEGLIRMVADGIGITDGYASAHASDDRGFVAAELGIRPRSAALSVGENVFNDAPDVVAYAEVPE